MQETTVAIVDDHVLIRKGMYMMIENMSGYKIVTEAANGVEFVKNIKRQKLMPDIVLLDINMPQMGGKETAEWIKENLPLTRVIVLSMFDDEQHIIQMVKAGARGYIVKNGDAAELERAMNEVMKTGFFCNDFVDGKLAFRIQNDKQDLENGVRLSDREREFLKLACSEKTYKEIAVEMSLSVRTVEGYRDALFLKLNLNSRVGLVLYALKKNIATL